MSAEKLFLTSNFWVRTRLADIVKRGSGVDKKADLFFGVSATRRNRRGSLEGKKMPVLVSKEEKPRRSTSLRNCQGGSSSTYGTTQVTHAPAQAVKMNHQSDTTPNLKKKGTSREGQ